MPNFAFIVEKTSTKKKILHGAVEFIEANIVSSNKCGGAVDNEI